MSQTKGDGGGLTLELRPERSATNISIPSLLQSWSYDPLALDAYFEICVRNWKEYGGKKPRDFVAKLHGVLLQAIRGDYVILVDEETKDGKPKKLTPAKEEWRRLKGTDKSTAKRRFITLLRSLDDKLLDITEKPKHFTLKNDEGVVVCPWSNTVRGCPLQLLDKQGQPLDDLIDRCMDNMLDPVFFRRWITENERHHCCLGVHQPIIHVIARPYLYWFNMKICGGFKPYDFKAYHRLLRRILDRQSRRFQDLMNNSKDHSHLDAVRHLDGLLDMMKQYRDYTKEHYVYEVPCDRHIYHCNQRRILDRGWNHTHPMNLSLTDGNFSQEAYERVAAVREQCRAAGLSLVTGVQKSLDSRYMILFERLERYHKQQEIARLARERLEKANYRENVSKSVLLHTLPLFPIVLYPLPIYLF